MLTRLALAASAALLALPAAAQSPAPDDTLRARAHRVGTALLAGDYDRLAALADTSVTRRLTREMVVQTPAQIAAGFGALVSRGPVRGPALVQGARVMRQQVRFERADQDLVVAFSPEGRSIGFFVVPPEPDGTLPAYADTANVRETAVRVGDLPGIVTLPRTVPARGVPAVVLVHGSGAHDADELAGGTRVFRDLAHGLAAEGIAVVRYVKRTAFDPSVLRRPFSTAEEVTDDVHAALRLLRATPGIDTTRLFVAGHSLGGMLAPRVAQQDGRLAGIALLAAPALPLHRIVRDQVMYLTAADTSESALEARRVLLAQIDEVDRALVSGPPDRMVMSYSAAYWRDLAAYDPPATARALLPRTRVLVLQGGRDYQVTPARDYAAWQRALAGQRGVAFRLLPSLNHLFVAGQGESRPAEYAQPAFVDAEAVAALAAWVKSTPARSTAAPARRPATPNRPARTQRRGRGRQ